MQMELLWQADQQPRIFNLMDQKPLVIGRRKDCDIVLQERTISRRHAALFADSGMVHLHNLSKTNAIYVCTKRKLEMEQATILKQGHIIQLGFKQLYVKSMQIVDDIPVLQLTDEKEQIYRITDDKPITLGRRDVCDIVLDNRTVSRRHAEITFYKGEFFVRNLSETTPIYTFIKYKLKHGQTTAIKPGYTFKMGPVEIQAQNINEQLLAEDEWNDIYKIRCHGCQRKISAAKKDCPWCGLMLAGGLTAN